MTDSFWQPSVEDVIAIHDEIVSEYADTHAGVQRRGEIEYALDFVAAESVPMGPETIHEKAFHLLRLLVAGHPFTDAIKRTALNTVAVFYFLNGYRFKYDDEIRSICKRFGIDEKSVDQEATIEYLRSHTEAIEFQDEIERWRVDLVRFGLDRLTDDSSDPND